MKNKTGKRLVIATNDIQRKFDETRATEAKRIAGGYIATAADRADDPYLSADSIVYEIEPAKHTTVPWVVKRTSNLSENCCSIYAASENKWVCTATEANAAFIVQACNAHEELLEALKECADALGTYLQSVEGGKDDDAESAYQHAFAIIAKAEGRET